MEYITHKFLIIYKNRFEWFKENIEYINNFSKYIESRFVQQLNDFPSIQNRQNLKREIEKYVVEQRNPKWNKHGLTYSNPK